jgi:hypothetical protein
MSKKWTLAFIQAAWVAEAAALILYTFCAVPLLDTERLSLWLTALPILSGIIAGQGAAAGIGPLVSDHIKTRTGGPNEHSMGQDLSDRKKPV